MIVDNIKSQALRLSQWSRRNRVVKLHFPALNAELTVLACFSAWLARELWP